MKRESGLYFIILVASWIGGVVLLTGCREDPVMPTLTTVAVSNITINEATTGGDIISNGGAEVTSSGVCWGTASQPLISDSHTSDNQGEGSFTSSITGLSPGTLYYVRAYATNIAGTAYGNEVSFTSASGVATITTTAVTIFTATTAVSGGNIILDGGAAVTTRGVCWAATENPPISNSKTSNGSGTGNFNSDIGGLTPATTYHVRAYATNSVGTTYGNDVTFLTLAVPPTLTTATVSSVTRTSAMSGGSISSNGGAAVTAKGVCWSKSPGPISTGLHTSDGTGSNAFLSNLTNLDPNTNYYVRAYATNSAGTSYGNELWFTTDPVTSPTLTTDSVTGVALTSAISGGNITDNNGAPVTVSGVCWNTNGTPTISDSKTTDGTLSGSFTSNISGLTAGTLYYVRAYATNSSGTGYGSEIRFSTSVSDIDGNVYKTVVIGTQMWMQSDLKTTRLNNNTVIPNVTVNDDWKNLTSMGYCWYNNNPSYGSTYGILYNYYVIETSMLCPSGWHVPTDNNFKTLELYLGMTQAQVDGTLWRGTDQGTQLKNTSSWSPSSGNGSNSSGFAGVAGGYRWGVDGGFSSLGSVSYWWSSTLHWDDTTKGLYRRLDSNQTGVYREGVIKAGGKFVRCLKN